MRFAISAGDGGAEVRDLPHIAGMAAAYGLSPEDALRSVTLWPAQIFGVADRFGSLEVGKTANLVVVDGDVLEARTNTRYLFIDGRAEMKESGPVPRGAWAAVHNCENCPRCQKLTAARLGRCADCILFSHDHVGRPVAESKQGCV